MIKGGGGSFSSIFFFWEKSIKRLSAEDHHDMIRSLTRNRNNDIIRQSSFNPKYSDATFHL
jgi:hypothetical protein